jgi:hypothetical protein
MERTSGSAETSSHARENRTSPFGSSTPRVCGPGSERSCANVLSGVLAVATPIVTFISTSG